MVMLKGEQQGQVLGLLEGTARRFRVVATEVREHKCISASRHTKESTTSHQRQSELTDGRHDTPARTFGALLRSAIGTSQNEHDPTQLCF